MAAKGDWRQLNANYVLSVIKENSKTRLDNSHALRAADTPVSMSAGKRQSFHVLTPFTFESHLLKLSLLSAGYTAGVSPAVQSHLVYWAVPTSGASSSSSVAELTAWMLEPSLAGRHTSRKPLVA